MWYAMELDEDLLVPIIDGLNGPRHSQNYTWSHDTPYRLKVQEFSKKK